MSFSIPPKYRRFAVAATAMFISMICIWWSIWSIAASSYRNFVDNWIVTHRPAGYEVSYEERMAEGFPRHITLHFTNFILQNSDGVKIQAHDVLLSTLPWRWHKFNAKLKHGFDLSIPFNGHKTLFISTEATAHNHTELADNGDWQLIDLHLTNAKALWGADPFFSANNFSIEFERPDTAPTNTKEAGLSIKGAAEDMMLPQGLNEPFGPQLENIDLDLRIMGDVPDPRRKQSVADWNAGGGTVEFDKFFLHWGPLLLDTHGTLGLDDDLQPEGAFSARIGNQHEVLKTLIAKDYIPKRQQGMLSSALDLFAKKTKVGDTEGIEAPIAVQLGGLFLGPVRMFEFSDIEWGEAPPPLMDMPIAPLATESPAPSLPTVIAPTPVLPSSPTR